MPDAIVMDEIWGKKTTENLLETKKIFCNKVKEKGTSGNEKRVKAEDGTMLIKKRSN